VLIILASQLIALAGLPLAAEVLMRGFTDFAEPR